jgi:thiamine-phosphate pyrophosphorylase
VSLADARLYLVSPARIRAGDLADLIPELAAAGVDVIQLREKEMEAGPLLELGRPLAESCREAGVPFVVNDRPDVALALGADGVHLGQDDLPIDVSREIMPKAFHGLSTHSEAQVAAAISAAPDYIAVGPVNATPTKPGRPGTGLPLVSYAAAEIAGIPWFVTGGMATDTIPAVLEAGGRRVVVVRAIVEASDPPAAAAGLRTVLDQVPL